MKFERNLIEIAFFGSVIRIMIELTTLLKELKIEKDLFFLVDLVRLIFPNPFKIDSDDMQRALLVEKVTHDT